MRPAGSQMGWPSLPTGVLACKPDTKRGVSAHAGGAQPAPSSALALPSGLRVPWAPSCPSHPGLRPSLLGQCLPTPPASPASRFHREELTAPQKGLTHRHEGPRKRGQPGACESGPWKGPPALSPSARCLLPGPKGTEGLTALEAGSVNCPKSILATVIKH